MTVEELRRAELLRTVDEAALARAIAEGWVNLRRCAKRTTVHHQGEACGALEVVLSGSLAAYSLLENGSAITMFEFRAGSAIGGNLLFGDFHDYPLNIYCVTDCALLRVDRAAVELFLASPGFALAFVKSLSLNSQGMNRKITMLTQKTLRENILDYLRAQAKIQGSKTVELPVSKRELADRLGVQRPSLFRELKRLKDEGIIEVRNRRIRLLD